MITDFHQRCAQIMRAHTGPFRISLQVTATTNVKCRVFAGTHLVSEYNSPTPEEAERRFIKGEYSAIEQPF